MMRQSVRLFSAADGGVLKADAVIVGGGVAGCLVAGRLGMENMKTLVIEEGSDIRKCPVWHRTLPASLIAHRVAKRGYENKETVTTPQKMLNGGSAEVWIPAPRVLGGRGVMGSRTWNVGAADDWIQSPWSFRDELLPRLRSFENMECFVPHRGKRGKFLICRPRNFSPFFKPFCEAMSQDVPLISEFTRKEFDVRIGCGRPETFVDQEAGVAHSTLQRYLMDTITLNRPVRVECDAKVVGIRASADKQLATGVTFCRQDGQLVDVEASLVIIAAGSIGSPRLLAASRGTINVDGTVGTNFWDVPQMVLQYKTKITESHNSYLDPLVRTLLKADLHFSHPRLSLRSSWDDMITYWSSTGSPTPDVEILFQPFTLNNDGRQPIPGEHGCQFVVRPRRPKSRGAVSATGAIDPNYFAVEEDLVSLRKGVEYIKAAVAKKTSLVRLIGAPVAERLESSGINGGTCFPIVDPATFQVRGTVNVFACGDSVIPSPLSGNNLPYTICLTDMFVDRLLRKKDVRRKIEDDPTVSETRIVY